VRFAMCAALEVGATVNAVAERYGCSLTINRPPPYLRGNRLNLMKTVVHWLETRTPVLALVILII